MDKVYFEFVNKSLENRVFPKGMDATLVDTPNNIHLRIYGGSRFTQFRFSVQELNTSKNPQHLIDRTIKKAVLKLIH